MAKTKKSSAKKTSPGKPVSMAKKKAAAGQKKPADARDTEKGGALKKEDKQGGKDMFDPANLRFAPTGEWVFIKDRSTIVVGLSDIAQGRLGEVTSVELTEPDDHHYEAEEEISIIESLKTSSYFHAPVAGVVTSINTRLLSHPELINTDAYGEGWLFEMTPDDMGDVSELMDIYHYESMIPEEAEEE